MTQANGPNVSAAVGFARRFATTWLALAGMGVLACAELREPTRPSRCLDFREDVQPVLAGACAGCHGSDAPAGDFGVTSYRDLVSPAADGSFRVTAGDADSELLARARGAGGHPAADVEVLAVLDRWVVACGLSYFANNLVHPLGWVNPRDPGWHGAVLAESGWDFAACAKCHGEGSNVSGGSSGKSCTSCHAQGPTACNTCHGDAQSAAPPRDRKGGVLTSDQGVGAHRTHVMGGLTLGLDLACTECHLTPVDWRDVGHVFLADGSLDPPRAEVVLGALAQASLEGFESRRPAAATYDPVSGGCLNAYCHGAVLGDLMAQPVTWTQTPAPAAYCDRCHGLPPVTHPVTWSHGDCAWCHGRVVDTSLNIIDASLHLDGRLSLGDSSQTCSACHGSAANPAPPAGLNGETASTSLAVGAHQAHVQAQTWRGPIPCGDCHNDPQGATFYERVIAGGHLDTTLPAEVFPAPFQGLAAADSASPSFDRDLATCSNVYCHGAGTLLEQDTSPSVDRVKSWTTADATSCGTCHGIPPQDTNPSHATATVWDCHLCHSNTITPDAEIIFDAQGQSTHVNGVVDP